MLVHPATPSATTPSTHGASAPHRPGRRRAARMSGVALALTGATALAQFALAPTAMAAMGAVQATGSVNVRSAPSTGSHVLGVLTAGEKAPQSAVPTHGFVPITWHGHVGYVSASYVTGETGDTTVSAPTIPTPTSGKAASTLWTTQAVNVRAGAATSTAVVTQLATATQVQATGVTQGAWTQVTLSGAQRWICTTYLTSTAPTTTSTPVVSPTTPTTPVSTPAPNANAAEAVAFAQQQLGKPYVYGATGPDSWDCSGLTRAAWSAAGVSIPRVSYAQLSQLTTVSRDDLQPGDIIGFYTGGHVGIYVGNGMVIHAPHTGDVVRLAQLSAMHYYKAVRP